MSGKVLESHRDPTVALELLKEGFDLEALRVEVSVIVALAAHAAGARRNDSYAFVVDKHLDHGAGIVAFVRIGELDPEDR